MATHVPAACPARTPPGPRGSTSAMLLVAVEGPPVGTGHGLLRVVQRQEAQAEADCTPAASLSLSLSSPPSPLHLLQLHRLPLTTIVALECCFCWDSLPPP